MRRKPAQDFRDGVVWQKAHPLEEASKLLRVPFRDNSQAVAATVGWSVVLSNRSLQF